MLVLTVSGTFPSMNWLPAELRRQIPSAAGAPLSDSTTFLPLPPAPSCELVTRLVEPALRGLMEVNWPPLPLPLRLLYMLCLAQHRRKLPSHLHRSYAVKRGKTTSCGPRTTHTLDYLRSRAGQQANASETKIHC